MTSELEALSAEWEQVINQVKERTPDPEEIARMGKAISELKDKADKADRERKLKNSRDGRVVTREGQFAGYTSFDHSMLQSVLKSRINRMGSVTYEPDLLAKSIESRRELTKSYADYEAIERWEDGALKALEDAGNRSVKSSVALRQGIGHWVRDMREQMASKAMDSTTAGAGDELVPTFETGELWMDVNLATNVLPALRQTPMPTNPYDIPLQFGDVNWYPIAENVQGTTTDPTTAKATLTAQGLKAGVPFSDELNEDSIVPFVPELRASLVRNAAEIIDDVLLNADTTVTNNINADGATISTSDAGKAQWLLGFDGLIHLPLVDNTGQGTSVGAAVSANGVFNQVLRSMGRYGHGSQRGDVVFISDVNTAIAALAIDEVETVDKLGVRATISSGELGSVYGTPLIVSEQMLLAASDGKITDGAAGTTGRVLGVNTRQWAVGFRRGITLESEREAGKGQTTLWAHLRIALTARGTRSSATHTALAYNITNVT